jgi:hypothetical protein
MKEEWLTWGGTPQFLIYKRWDESCPPKKFPILYIKEWKNNDLARFNIDVFVKKCVEKNIQVAWNPPHFTEYHYGQWKFYFKTEDDKLLAVLSMPP